MLFYLVFAILVLIAFFDVYWILRLVLTRLVSKLLPAITIEDEGVAYNLCWTTDVDYFWHMNNGKYFREMDFGRFDFYFRTGLAAYIEARPGMFVVQHGASIRYRRPIDILVPFKQVTRLVYWDDRSLYFEQKFVSLADGFVRAVALCKNTVVGGSVTDMMQAQGCNIPIKMPKEVELWMQSQEVTAGKLRPAGPSNAALVEMDKNTRNEEEARSEEQNNDIKSVNAEHEEKASLLVTTQDFKVKDKSV